MSERVEVRKLGLAAYIKMSGATLLEIEKGRFVFESDKSAKDWEMEYLNSCCHRHDTELINLRKLIT